MRTMLALASAVLVLGCLSLSKVNASAGVAVSDDETATKARELWEKVLVAKGGRERLRKITNLYVAADQGQGYRQSTLNVFPDYRFDFSYDPKRENTAIEVSNAKTGIVWWQVSNEAKPRKYQEEDVYRNLSQQFIYLLVTSEVDPVPLGLRKEWIGLKRVDVIEVEAKDWRVDYYIDPKTHLPLRVVLPNGLRAHDRGDMNHIIALDDYAAVDNVMMPHKATHTFTTNPEKLVERLKFEINANYDPQVFEQAPTTRTSAEAWRAKK
jgi:hypothetical protein